MEEIDITEEGNTAFILTKRYLNTIASSVKNRTPYESYYPGFIALQLIPLSPGIWIDSSVLLKIK